MADTLDALQDHWTQRLGRPARIVVWAHNSHIGDARATSSDERGQINLGQLVRERHERPGETFLLGFTTHDGTVAAASDWDAPVERKIVRPSRPESIERLLHDCGPGLFALRLTGQDQLSTALAGARLERAIGVIYRPDTELASHYFLATLPDQFDAVVHVDRSRAVRPLDAPYDWEPSGEPETFPSGV
jgi:erythromycin esterase-like protein